MRERGPRCDQAQAPARQARVARERFSGGLQSLHLLGKISDNAMWLGEYDTCMREDVERCKIAVGSTDVVRSRPLNTIYALECRYL